MSAHLILQSLHIALTTRPAQPGSSWAASASWAAFEDRARELLAHGLTGRADLIESNAAGLAALYMTAVSEATQRAAPAESRPAGSLSPRGELTAPAPAPAQEKAPAAAPAPQKGQPPGKARR